ncbi:hypothetical protein EVAR_48571_1 [Eumeta japonica]|uniref:Uncharacterized protein n=1 Tax=Eumeta variegata TaxID=151549 RepID=A0A4C1XDM0_EUMVA|nr:hypothetical protein EVAR_48571_1 [Eumeta japonica]
MGSGEQQLFSLLILGSANQKNIATNLILKLQSSTNRGVRALLFCCSVKSRGVDSIARQWSETAAKQALIAGGAPPSARCTERRAQRHLGPGAGMRTAVSRIRYRLH